jgi:hypothetical protein
MIILGIISCKCLKCNFVFDLISKKINMLILQVNTATCNFFYFKNGR